MLLFWLVLVLFCKRSKPVENALDRKELSIIRASIFLQTYLSIFAVDFHVYPLKFAKTESYGISLVKYLFFPLF